MWATTQVLCDPSAIFLKLEDSRAAHHFGFSNKKVETEKWSEPNSSVTAQSGQRIDLKYILFFLAFGPTSQPQASKQLDSTRLDSTRLDHLPKNPVGGRVCVCRQMQSASHLSHPTRTLPISHPPRFNIAQQHLPTRTNQSVYQNTPSRGASTSSRPPAVLFDRQRNTISTGCQTVHPGRPLPIIIDDGIRAFESKPSSTRIALPKS